MEREEHVTITPDPNVARARTWEVGPRTYMRWILTILILTLLTTGFTGWHAYRASKDANTALAVSREACTTTLDTVSLIVYTNPEPFNITNVAAYITSQRAKCMGETT